MERTDGFRPDLRRSVDRCISPKPVPDHAGRAKQIDHAVGGGGAKEQLQIACRMLCDLAASIEHVGLAGGKSRAGVIRT